nr:thiamine phosphate synthase [Rhabdochromatium marinum]
MVTDSQLCGTRGVIATVAAAVAGGATMVQLRDKTASDAALIELGQALKAALVGQPARLMVNDRLEVAAAIGADGLHIGQSDADPAAARARLGPQAILGLSVETPAMARAVDPELIDYLGVGPVFATPTKADHATPLGWDGLRAICAAAPELPKVAIGGLKAEHAGAVIQAGAQGLALVSAICAAADPQAAAAAIQAQVREARVREARI